ncbi:MAG: hypothetical protein KGJ80_21460, partial [Chloroflexota bacterium]|nr:hypothetical protein [Chloroflexota bacterium]
MVALDAPNYVTANRLQVYSASGNGVLFQTTATIGNTTDGGMIWVSQASGALYIAASQDNLLQIVDATSLSVVQTIPMTDPFGITENRGLGRMYIGNRAASTLSIQPDNLGGSAPTP